jgi:hypothetical protein
LLAGGNVRLKRLMRHKVGFGSVGVRFPGFVLWPRSVAPGKMVVSYFYRNRMRQCSRIPNGMVCPKKMRSKPPSQVPACRWLALCSTISAVRTLGCSGLELVSYMDLRPPSKTVSPASMGSHSWHLHHLWICETSSPEQWPFASFSWSVR